MIRKRLTVNINKIVRALEESLSDLILYEPSSEDDFKNVVYVFLRLKFKRYDVSDEPEAVVSLGKRHKPDLSIENQVAIELKVARNKRSIVSAINQARMYRSGGYPASIAIIYLGVEYERDIEELKRLEKRRIYTIFIPSYLVF